MILKSVILRGFKAINLQVATKDNSLSLLVRRLTNVKLSEKLPIKYCNIKKLEVNQELSEMNLDWIKETIWTSVLLTPLRRTSRCRN